MGGRSWRLCIIKYSIYIIQTFYLRNGAYVSILDKGEFLVFWNGRRCTSDRAQSRGF